MAGYGESPFGPAAAVLRRTQAKAASVRQALSTDPGFLSQARAGLDAAAAAPVPAETPGDHSLREPLRDQLLDLFLSLDFPGFFKEEVSDSIPDLRRDLDSRPDPRTWVQYRLAQHRPSDPRVRRRWERELLLAPSRGSCWKLCNNFRRKFPLEIKESWS